MVAVCHGCRVLQFLPMRGVCPRVVEIRALYAFCPIEEALLNCQPPPRARVVSEMRSPVGLSRMQAALT